MKEDSFESVLADVRLGRPVIIVDDVTRENEGDLMVAAELVTAETLQLMMNEGKGLICLSIEESLRLALELPFQATENNSAFGTNFEVSFDSRSVSSFGVTAEARATTIREAVRAGAKPADFVRPGYVFPVCAVPGGVLRRRGQTEGSVDLSRIAGLLPAGVICEVMASDGTMLRGASLMAYCQRLGFKLTSVETIYQWRISNEVCLRKTAEMCLDGDTPLGRSASLTKVRAQFPDVPLRVVVYLDDVDEQEHLAIVVGEPTNGSLVRIHSECLTGDVFSSRRCDCGPQFEQALASMLQAGSGVLVYLHQEGRGIGLGNKLRAYELQDAGLDTVDANLQLGFDVDSRNYRAGAQILKDLQLSEVVLMTNNPEKVEALNGFGVLVKERCPVIVETDSYNCSYLQAKQRRLGHLLGSEDSKP